MISPAALNKE